jgi:hypothetical protein
MREAPVARVYIQPNAGDAGGPWGRPTRATSSSAAPAASSWSTPTMARLNGQMPTSGATRVAAPEVPVVTVAQWRPA